jgi:hypothetical protein
MDTFIAEPEEKVMQIIPDPTKPIPEFTLKVMEIIEKGEKIKADFPNDKSIKTFYHRLDNWKEEHKFFMGSDQEEKIIEMIRCSYDFLRIRKTILNNLIAGKNELIEI